MSEVCKCHASCIYICFICFPSVNMVLTQSWFGDHAGNWDHCWDIWFQKLDKLWLCLAQKHVASCVSLAWHAPSAYAILEVFKVSAIETGHSDQHCPSCPFPCIRASADPHTHCWAPASSRFAGTLYICTSGIYIPVDIYHIAQEPLWAVKYCCRLPTVYCETAYWGIMCHVE